jgi:hypothetical protein
MTRAFDRVARAPSFDEGSEQLARFAGSQYQSAFV